MHEFTYRSQIARAITKWQIKGLSKLKKKDLVKLYKQKTKQKKSPSMKKTKISPFFTGALTNPELQDDKLILLNHPDVRELNGNVYFAFWKFGQTDLLDDDPDNPLIQVCETKNFAILKSAKYATLVGSGDFGAVFHCCPRLLFSGEDAPLNFCKFVMKVQVWFSDPFQASTASTALRELYFHSLLSERAPETVPHIYEHRICVSKEQKFKQLSFVMDAFDHTMERRKFLRADWKQMLDALYQLRYHLILHRDVKPDNFLKRTNSFGQSQIVITDLGLAKQLNPADMKHWKLDFEENKLFTTSYFTPDVAQKILDDSNQEYGWIQRQTNNTLFDKFSKKHQLEPFMDFVAFDAYLVTHSYTLEDLEYAGNPFVPGKIWDLLAALSSYWNDIVEKLQTVRQANHITNTKQLLEYYGVDFS
jgi:hypothetical protein